MAARIYDHFLYTVKTFVDHISAPQILTHARE